MRRIILLSLFALLVSDASGQRRGGPAGGFGRGGSGFGRYRPAFPYGYGYGFLGYDSDDVFGSYPQPMGYYPQPIVLIQAPPPMASVEPPPRPAHAVITNYPQPASGASAAEGGQTFGIVLKGGFIQPAVTVMAAGDVLHCVDPEDRHMRISMRDVDREATIKLNRERKLNLHLPAMPE
jgi:hypothetical protein